TGDLLPAGRPAHQGLDAGHPGNEGRRAAGTDHSGLAGLRGQGVAAVDPAQRAAGVRDRPARHVGPGTRGTARATAPGRRSSLALLVLLASAIALACGCGGSARLSAPAGVKLQREHLVATAAVLQSLRAVTAQEVSAAK